MCSRLLAYPDHRWPCKRVRNVPAPQTAQSTSGEHTELRNVQTTFLKARSWSMRAWIGQRCCRTSHCGGAYQSLLPPAWAAAGSRSHSRRSACYTTTFQRIFGFGNRSVNTSRQVPRDLVWCAPLISALAIRLGAIYMCNLPSSGMYHQLATSGMAAYADASVGDPAPVLSPTVLYI